MKSKLLLLSLIVTASAYAGPKVIIGDERKAEVQLEENGASTSGGMRQEVAVVSVKKGFFSEPMPIDERIAALESMTCFFKLLKKQGIDPDQKVSGDYSGKRLKDVLAELLPNVPVEFSDVDDSVTILKMTASDARLEVIMDLLDDAAGVYFTYSMSGLVIASTPASVEA
jgi:hypothetical protein